MAGADQSIGLMDGAYFVGRKEIMDWVNETCQTGLTKIEQTANGAIACQLLDSIFPGNLPMAKVDWSANKDYEYIHNYKLLQKAFTKLKIDRHIEVDKLIRGRYQDNLEFMQWFKRFHELNASGQEYDAASQRAKGKGASVFDNKYSEGYQPSRTMTKRTQAATKSAPRPKNAQNKGRTLAPATKKTLPGDEDSKALAELKTENAELTELSADLKVTVDGLEKERDFYFGKLRDIEIMLQSLGESNDSELAKKILAILYATDEEFTCEDQGDGENQPEGAVASAPEDGNTMSKDSSIAEPSEEVEMY